MSVKQRMDCPDDFDLESMSWTFVVVVPDHLGSITDIDHMILHFKCLVHSR